MRILIIEDEPKVASFIKRGLEENNHLATIITDGQAGIEEANTQPYDLIILDVNLPVMSGIQVCRTIRETNDVPILMLTALGTLENKVEGLDAGADDYLLKPFEFKELLARIRALSRRPRISVSQKDVYRIADLEVDLNAKSVKRSQERIDLTAKEFFLLEYFIKNQGKVLSRTDIGENVWNLSFDTGTNIIDVYVNYLRRKVDKDYTPKLIHTVKGLGYVMKVEE
ncbi:MAG TPA: response regulator transcription factor [Cytophagaceae bacterium]|jgi:DNA-binding response OmpR family regulator|nr:response regulator transcription factor [Cytophagaceae bacterium]